MSKEDRQWATFLGLDVAQLAAMSEEEREQAFSARWQDMTTEERYRAIDEDRHWRLPNCPRKISTQEVCDILAGDNNAATFTLRVYDGYDTKRIQKTLDELQGKGHAQEVWREDDVVGTQITRLEDANKEDAQQQPAPTVQQPTQATPTAQTNR